MSLFCFRHFLLIPEICKFSTVMVSPGPAFQEHTCSCHENVQAPKVVSSNLQSTDGLIVSARIEIVTIYAFTILYCIFSFPFSPTGLVPEVPLLQAFENELGRGWTRLIIAILTIVCLCFSLLELSLPLHRMVSNHFPPSFLVTTF